MSRFGHTKSLFSPDMMLWTNVFLFQSFLPSTEPSSSAMAIKTTFVCCLSTFLRPSVRLQKNEFVKINNMNHWMQKKYFIFLFSSLLCQDMFLNTKHILASKSAVHNSQQTSYLVRMFFEKDKKQRRQVKWTNINQTYTFFWAEWISKVAW